MVEKKKDGVVGVKPLQYKEAWLELYNREWLDDLLKEVECLETIYPASYIFNDIDEYFRKLLPKNYDKGVLVIRYTDNSLKKIILWDKRE